MFSSLIKSKVLASPNNYNQGRKGHKICKITPHHMAGVMSAEQCAKIFQNPNRQASANYCIGNNGDIVGCVPEESRSWCSSNANNDYQAITIEVSNNAVGGDWTISNEAWNSLVNLCVDICKRYNFKLVYDNTSNGSLTRHNMFSSTNCPGKYLQSRFQELADTVNARLNATNQNPAKKSIDEIANEVIAGKWGNGADRKERLKQAGYDATLVQNKVNSLLGMASAPNKKSNDEIANEVIKGLWGNGAERKERLAKAGYNYSEVQALVNKKIG